MMLRQEINLYRNFEQPRTSATLLTWKRFWMFTFSVFVLLSVIYISSLLHNVYLRNKLKNLQAEAANHQAQFAKIKNTFPQLFFNKDINEAIKSMKSDMAAQKEIAAILSRHAKFSEDLSAFSRTIVPNVWLSAINIQKNGDEIIIKGDSIGMSNVHQFISNFEKDAIFKNYKVELNEAKDLDVTDNVVKLKFEIMMVRNEHE